jgi:hypothetical protein
MSACADTHTWMVVIPTYVFTFEYLHKIHTQHIHMCYIHVFKHKVIYTICAKVNAHSHILVKRQFHRAQTACAIRNLNRDMRKYAHT